MAKDKLTEYSATNASNDVIGDINVAEGMLPSAVNNALREQMTHLKNFADGTDGINVLSLDDDDASAAIKIQAPSAVTTTTTLTLPDGDGDAGAMLQTNGSGQLAWSTAYRNRNIIVNGACAVSQRSTSVSSVTSGGYKTVDRFGLTLNSSGTFTVSQSSTAPEGFANSLKFDCTTADASPDYFIIEHKIEGQDLQQLKKGTSNAESVTLSFYVRSSKTGTYQVNLRDNDNSRQIGSTYAISSANTWERKEITFAGDTTGAFDNDNASSLEIEWWLAAGGTYNSGAVPTAWEAQSNGDRAAGLNVAIGASTSDDFYITGVQLEVGEQATPFEHRSYGDELARCQRYYQQVGGAGNTLALGQCANSTSAQFFYPLPHPVRADATVSVNNATYFRLFNAAISGIPAVTSMSFSLLGLATNNGFRIIANVASGLSAGDASHLYGNDTSGNTGIIKIDAEL